MMEEKKFCEENGIYEKTISLESLIKRRLKKRGRGALLNFQPLSMEKSYAATSRFRKTVKART